VKETDQLKDCFRYELSPKPPSLFDNISMRKGNKSSLVSDFKSEEATSKYQGIQFIF
jgi:hypothetical protein